MTDERDESMLDSNGQGAAGDGTGASSAPSTARATPADLGSELAADLDLLADPGIQARAAELLPLDLRRMVKALREKGARAKDVDAFERSAKKLRKEQVRLAAQASTNERRAKQEPSWRDALTTTDRGRIEPSFANLCLLLRHLYSGRLSYDVMAERPCIDDIPLDDKGVSTVRLALGTCEAVNFGKEEIADAIGLEGNNMRRFHPVRDYLARCRAAWDGKRRLDTAACDLLKVPHHDKLACVMFRRTLIAMTARGMTPGRKVDTLLILLGYQGAKKSTLFRTLGAPWFGDSKVDITDRKGCMVMSAKWVYEWPEVDRVFQKHSDSDIKAFVSQQADDYVPMYGRAVISVPRSWLAVGTTNKRRFLTDATGDRRAWIIDIHRNGKRWKVDAAKVAAMRDQLFGEAVAEYEAFQEADARGVAGDENTHRWWLNDAEEAEREKRTAEYHVENAWSEVVGRWLAGEAITCPLCKGSGNGMGHAMDGSPHPCGICRGEKHITRGALPVTSAGREYVTPSLVMTHALGIPPERQQAQGGKVADTLAELGWMHGARCRMGAGPKVTPYYSPAPNPEADAAEQEEEHESETRAGVQGS